MTRKSPVGGGKPFDPNFPQNRYPVTPGIDELLKQVPLCRFSLDGLTDEVDVQDVEPNSLLGNTRRRTSGTGIAPRLPLTSGGPTFSLERMAQNLRSALDDNAKGWAFVINRNGEAAADGAGGRAIDNNDMDSSGILVGGRDFTIDTRVNVASVSKHVTALATLRLMQALGLSRFDLILPWLPRGQPYGSRVDELTFRHLFTHHSGLVSTNSNFSQTLTDQGVFAALAAGANPTDPDTAPDDYKNVNYAVFRLIIPALWREAGQPLANADDPSASAFFYTAYVATQLFPLFGGNIGDESLLTALGDETARYYSTSDSIIGADFPNYFFWGGPAGWHLSARELAAILAFTAYTDDIIPAPIRDIMDDELLGWRPTNGAFGRYVGHGGSIDHLFGNSVRNRVRAAVMKFPIQVEAAFVANSLVDNAPATGGSAALLQRAYDNAWV
ncbi:MAG: serine hydrolase domain-containing protein [Pseudomonadota bacterium]